MSRQLPHCAKAHTNAATLPRGYTPRPRDATPRAKPFSRRFRVRSRTPPTAAQDEDESPHRTWLRSSTLVSECPESAPPPNPKALKTVGPQIGRLHDEGLTDASPDTGRAPPRQSISSNEKGDLYGNNSKTDQMEDSPGDVDWAGDCCGIKSDRANRAHCHPDLPLFCQIRL